MQKTKLEDTDPVLSENSLGFNNKKKTFFSNSLIKNSFKFFITILFFILVNRSIKKNDFQIIISRIDLSLLLFSFLFGIFGFYFQILRWRDVLKSQNLPCSLNVSTRTMFTGFLLGFLTPGRIGELFRFVGCCPERKTVSVFAVALERFFAVLMTVVFGLISVSAQLLFYKISVSAYFFIALVLSFIFFAFAGKIIIYLNRTMLCKISLFKSFFNSVNMMISGLSELPVKRIIGFSFLAQICLVIQTVLLLEMFGIGDYLKNFTIAAQAYAFMLFLPFFVANIGLREFSFTLFISQMAGVVLEKSEVSVIAFGVSNLILFMNIIIPAVIGLIWMFLWPEARGNYFRSESNFHDKAVYDK